MRRYPHKQNPAGRGFTLVEVMVVVVIIGMLAAILVPVLGGIIRRTNEAAVKVEINSMGNAIADFKATATSQLSFKKNDVLTVLGMAGKWIKARDAAGSEGLVPSNYVRSPAVYDAVHTAKSPAPKAAARPTSKVDRTMTAESAGTGEVATAFAKFEAPKNMSTNQMSFAKGDKFVVLEHRGQWLKCRDSTGKIGLVPGNYVRVAPADSSA